ncbi:MAG: class I SAM-dependent methyltransferase [Candidatus Bathyarchaeota archaeon]
MAEKGLVGALRGVLPPELLTLIPKSFDIIGSREKAVAVIEIPDELEPYKMIIAEKLMGLHKNVKTVLRKASPRKNIFRVREYELLLGDHNTEVLHKEYGCLFKLDPQKVYFSPRESTERLRIAEKVNPSEDVLVMFGGVCPYSIVIAKRQPLVKKILTVELNPIAYNYCLENVKLNKVNDKVYPIFGDVKDVCPKFEGKFDRVIMPLPKGGYQHLDLAISCLKNYGFLHFYHWATEEDLFSDAEKLVREAAKKLGRELEVMGKKKVLPYGPRTWKVCIDVKIF